MKTLQMIACLVSLSAVALAAPPNSFSPFSTPSASPTPPPPELVEYINEGKAAYTRGDYQAAQQAFEMAYQLDSRNIVAIGYLKRLKADAALGKTRSVPMDRQLAAVMIPQIQFHDATLGSAVDYLKSTVKRQTKNQVSVNIVVELPAEEMATKTVTLNLSNVPFTEALKYLGSVANLDIQYDKYAIIMKPNAQYTKAAAPAPAPGEPVTQKLPGQ
ncbi:MAG TPA: hypothetical protein VGM54_07220 [Chthoniobacter sp.]|jgi:tetratricopeptide (TPR) repeat protein